MSFEWNDEDSWGPSQQAIMPKLPVKLSRRGRWLAAIVLAIILSLAVIVSSFVTRQTTSLVGRVEEEVHASFAVIMEAAAREDIELASSFLSGSDQTWSDELLLLVARGGFFERSAFGLERLAPTGVITASVVMSPDLRSAELSYWETYAVAIGNGLTTTVRLKQTAVYRAGPNRWLLSPPTASFWGVTEVGRGRHLNLYYPARDAEIGRRLALDLDSKLAEMCAQIAGLDCPAAYAVNVELSTRPAALDGYSRPRLGGETAAEQLLPAPTLLGLPRDESGYQALFRGYAVNVVSDAIAGLTGYECCSREAFFRATLDKQLSQLGLKPWPLNRSEYGVLLQGSFRGEDLQALWLADSGPESEKWRQVYALVDFILARGGGAGELARMQRELLQPHERFLEWAALFLAEDYDLGPFEQDWLSFIMAQTDSKGAQRSTVNPLEAELLSLPVTDRVSEPAAGEGGQLAKEAKRLP